MADPRRALVSLLLMVGLPVVAPAQPVAEPLVEVTFRWFAVDGPKSLSYRPSPEAALAPLRSFSSALSPRYHYKGPPRWEVFGDDPAHPVAAVALPPGSSGDYLLLLRPAGVRGGAREVVVLRAAPGGPAAGELHVVNLTSHEYTLVQGQERWPVAPGPGRTLRPRPGEELTLWLRRARGERRVGWVELALESHARAWLVLFPPHRDGELQPQLRLLVDASNDDI